MNTQNKIRLPWLSLSERLSQPNYSSYQQYYTRQKRTSSVNPNRYLDTKLSTRLAILKERHFIGCVRYFQFHLFLVKLGILQSLLVLLFYLLPGIINGKGDSALENKLSNSSFLQPCYDKANALDLHEQWWEFPIDIFTGAGFMQNTPLFIGYYGEFKVLGFAKFSDLIVYLFIFSVIFTFLVLAKIAGEFKTKKAHQHLKNNHGFTDVKNWFTEWNFDSHEKEAVRRQKYEIKQRYLASKARDVDVKIINQQKEQTLQILLSRLLVWILYFTFVVVSLVAITVAENYANNALKNNTADNFWKLFIEYVPSIILAAVNFLGAIFSQGLNYLNERVEKYTKATSVNLTVFRTNFIRFLTLIFYAMVILSGIDCTESFFNSSGTYNETCGFCEETACWETHVGRSFYILTLSIIFFQFGYVLIELLWRGLFGKMIVTTMYIEENVRSLIYLQTVSWIGWFYCPILPILVCVSLGLLWITKYHSVVMNFKKSNSKKSKALLIYDGESFFYFILGLAFLISFNVVLISLSYIKPSDYCAPLQQGMGTTSYIDSVGIFNANIIKKWHSFNWVFSILLGGSLFFLKNLGKNKAVQLDTLQSTFKKSTRVHNLL